MKIARSAYRGMSLFYLAFPMHNSRELLLLSYYRLIWGRVSLVETKLVVALAKAQMNIKGVAGICIDSQMKMRVAVFYGVNNPTAKLWEILENTGVLR